MTYSIVARDPHTGELGVAVQTRWPTVGAIVPWVEAGVGAVATQADANVALGPRGLELMRAGRTAAMTLRELVEADPGAAVRQVGVVDAAGGSAAHTGSSCVEAAGHVTAADVSVQGNMLERQDTWMRMLEAFSQADGDLAARLMAALQAGEAAGGDVRGSQSAALIVAPGDGGSPPWARRFDIRVDDAPRPLDVLVRSLRTARAFEGLDAAIGAAEAGDLEEALRRSTVAYELAPEDGQVAFWHGIVLLASDRTAAGESLLVDTLQTEPRLATFATRAAGANHDSPLATAFRAAARIQQDHS